MGDLGCHQFEGREAFFGVGAPVFAAFDVFEGSEVLGVGPGALEVDGPVRVEPLLEEEHNVLALTGDLLEGQLALEIIDDSLINHTQHIPKKVVVVSVDQTDHLALVLLEEVVVGVDGGVVGADLEDQHLAGVLLQEAHDLPQRLLQRHRQERVSTPPLDGFIAASFVAGGSEIEVPDPYHELVVDGQVLADDVLLHHEQLVLAHVGCRVVGPWNQQVPQLRRLVLRHPGGEITQQRILMLL
mmetsp:Transcript_4510/g.4228  ORF Transcript_4510/g.4228 Transcript_4510/m.4228 type:complete len:242 (+) Transcript_4510:283-1008(+)